MLEACVLTINTSGEPVKPYYDHQKIDDYVIAYLDKNIKRYSKEYTITTNYYNETFTKVSSNYSRGVEICLKAKIFNFREYEKTQRFYISSREEL